jgi:hypothetical protein
MTVEASVAIGADNSQLLRVLQESKSAMTEFFVSVTEEGEGLGAMLEDIQGKFANAFNFAGLTVGIELVKQVGEAIERMGQKAVELRSMADVLGVTTDQMQAMQEASEHAGVSQETLVRTGERLITILTEARNGSGAAVEKLLQLGVTTDQINDPMFKLNDLLSVLHDRLVDTATAQATMNELLAVLGNRAGLAAEAIKKYDGSEESVKEVMAAVNGLAAEQNNKMATLGISWTEFSTKVENSSKKALLSLVDLSNWMRDHSPTLAALADTVGAPKSEAKASSGAFDASINIAEQQAKEIGDLAESLARQQVDANQKAQIAELDGIKQSVAAFRDGSTQKLEALQREHALAQEIYGSSEVDKVKAIYQQIIGEERAVYEAGLQADQETMSREDRHVQGVLRGYAAQIEANQRYFDEAEQNQKKLDQLTEFSEDLQTRLTKERSQLLQQQQALNQRVANEWYQKWSGVSGAIQSSFSGAISGMLRGTMTFAGAVQSIFSSVVDSLIQMFVKMGIQWAEGLIYQQVAQKATAISSITANSGIAATAAMASVAAIPFYGWAMAPEVGASTFAEGLAYLASASAAGGFDVPTGQNPVTQLHAREMVLPQSLADPIRDMASGKRGGPATAIPFKKMGDHMVIHMGNLKDALKSLGYQFKLA